MTTAEQAVGARIREIRTSRGWSQAELAARLGDVGLQLHQTGVAKIESAGRPLRVNELCALADVLGLAPGWLLPGDDDEGSRAAIAAATRRQMEAEVQRARELLAQAELRVLAAAGELVVNAQVHGELVELAERSAGVQHREED